MELLEQFTTASVGNGETPQSKMTTALSQARVAAVREAHLLYNKVAFIRSCSETVELCGGYFPDPRNYQGSTISFYDILLSRICQLAYLQIV